MKILDRKLLRDIWLLRGQALATGLVVACGIAAFVSMRTTYHSLRDAQRSYYAGLRFADVFADLRRAPNGLAQRIAAIPGVATVRTRIVFDVIVNIPGLDEPATARLVSVPERRQAMVNDLFLRSGRYVDPRRDDEVLASEAFTTANGLQIGDSLSAVINGRWKRLRIVGIALSPEYIYEVGAGSLFPDNRRFGVLWIGRRGVANAFDMESAFNNVVLTLQPGANRKMAIERMDQLLDGYGGIGAHDRDEQLSHRFISDEIAQNRVTSIWVPAIFLGVAGFLLHMVLSRLIAIQRSEIGLLKAFGYPSTSIAFHYVRLSLTTVAGGIGVGLAGGTLVGEALTGLYRDYYHFPELTYRFDARVVAQAAAISVAVAVLGAFQAVRTVVALPASEALRPVAPATFRPGLLEQLGLYRMLSPGTRMILRNLRRRPIKALLSVVGIACAVGILVIGGFLNDAVNHLIRVQFDLLQREDVSVVFRETRPASTRYLLGQLPGVIAAEPFRSVTVRLRHEHRTRRVELQGLPRGGWLRRLRDIDLHAIQLPEDGLVLDSRLARLLGARPGDRLSVEVLQGRRMARDIGVAAILDESIGLGAYMSERPLSRILQDGGAISGARMTIDPLHRVQLFRLLRQMPLVSSVNIREAARASFDEVIERSIRMATIVNVLFACVIAFGIVYNSARISLSERGNELASLRVLGFTRREVNGLLLGELVLLTLVAIPLGLLLGTGACAILAPRLETDMYRIPLVLTRQTCGFASLIVIAAATLSALLVAQRMRRLDLIAVLKTRE